MDAQKLTQEIQDLIEVGKPLEYDEVVSNNYLKPLQKLLHRLQSYFNRNSTTRSVGMEVYQRFIPIADSLTLRPYYRQALEAYTLQGDLIRAALKKGKVFMLKDIKRLFVPREGSGKWSPAAHKLFLTALMRNLQEYEKELDAPTVHEPQSDVQGPFDRPVMRPQPQSGIPGPFDRPVIPPQPQSSIPGPFDRPVIPPQPQSSIPGPFDRPVEAPIPATDTLNAQLLGGQTELPAALASALVLLRQTGIPLSAIYEATLGNSKFRNYIVRVGVSLVGLGATVALLTW
jgi:hypothetical protein